MTAARRRDAGPERNADRNSFDGKVDHESGREDVNDVDTESKMLRTSSGGKRVAAFADSGSGRKGIANRGSNLVKSRRVIWDC